VEIEEFWAENQGVRLHYLDSRRHADESLTSLLCVHGAMGMAEHFRSEMAVYAPRRCVALSLRGRGQSDAPAVGYSFQDQVSDVEAVVMDAGLNGFCIMAHSMGVPIALGYAIRQPELLKGLILLDYPARYPAIPHDWVERVLSSMPPEQARPHVVKGLQRESVEVQLWEQLWEVRCPTLVIRGGQNGLLKAEQAELFTSNLPGAKVIVFEDSGHEVWKPDYDRFVTTVKDFLATIG
jgi:pimeloyl-ACP methyl ester carboxylesterase